MGYSMQFVKVDLRRRSLTVVEPSSAVERSRTPESASYHAATTMRRDTAKVDETKLYQGPSHTILSGRMRCFLWLQESKTRQMRMKSKTMFGT